MAEGGNGDDLNWSTWLHSLSHSVCDTAGSAAADDITVLQAVKNLQQLCSKGEQNDGLVARVYPHLTKIFSRCSGSSSIQKTSTGLLLLVGLYRTPLSVNCDIIFEELPEHPTESFLLRTYGFGLDLLFSISVTLSVWNGQFCSFSLNSANLLPSFLETSGLGNQHVSSLPRYVHIEMQDFVQTLIGASVNLSSTLQLKFIR